MIITLGELTNLYMLAYQHETEHVIMHFVALEIIMELPEHYIESMIDDNIKKRIFETIEYMHSSKSSKDIESRGVINWGFRITYKILRALQVSFLFYLQPFIVVFVYFLIPAGTFPEEE